MIGGYTKLPGRSVTWVDRTRAEREAKLPAVATLGPLFHVYSSHFRVYSFVAGEWEYGFAYAMPSFDPSFDNGRTFEVCCVAQEPSVHFARDRRVGAAAYLGRLREARFGGRQLDQLRDGENWPALERVCRELLAISTDPVYFMALGQALDGLGKRTEAVAAYQAALDYLAEHGCTVGDQRLREQAEACIGRETARER